jgi:hypothetical protein
LDLKAGEAMKAGIVGKKLIATSELCSSGVNGIRQLEMGVRAKTGSSDEHLAADGDDLQGGGGLQGLEVRGLPLGMVIE